MTRPVAFANDVCLVVQGKYCICSQKNTYSEVLIPLRLKVLIEQEDWLHLLPEDLQEIRSLRELGFLVEKSS